MPTTRTVRLIGAPIEAGATTRGCAMGPTALRIAGLAHQLIELGHSVEDVGDIAPAALGINAPAPPNARRFAEVGGWVRPLSDAVLDALAAGTCPIVLGGDHSLSMGSVNGAARHAQAQGRPLSVIWLDAHADFNTPQTSPSGNLHGMSVAAFTGETALAGLFGEGRDAPVAAPDVHLIGIRSVDPEERHLLHARGVDVIDMRRIDEEGVAAPLKRILAAISDRNALLHVSFDVDFLDPSLAPGVGTTVPGGATFREAHLALEMLHDSGRVTSVDVAELNPFLDERGRTALLLANLLASLFGRQVFDRLNTP